MKISIGIQTLNDGTKIYLPYERGLGDIVVPFEPYNTIGEAFDWICREYPLYHRMIIENIVEETEIQEIKEAGIKYLGGNINE